MATPTSQNESLLKFPAATVNTPSGRALFRHIEDNLWPRFNAAEKQEFIKGIAPHLTFDKKWTSLSVHWLGRGSRTVAKLATGIAVYGSKTITGQKWYSDLHPDIRTRLEAMPGDIAPGFVRGEGREVGKRRRTSAAVDRSETPDKSVNEEQQPAIAKMTGAKKTSKTADATEATDSEDHDDDRDTKRSRVNMEFRLVDAEKDDVMKVDGINNDKMDLFVDDAPNARQHETKAEKADITNSRFTEIPPSSATLALIDDDEEDTTIVAASNAPAGGHTAAEMEVDDENDEEDDEEDHDTEVVDTDVADDMEHDDEIYALKRQNQILQNNNCQLKQAIRAIEGSANLYVENAKLKATIQELQHRNQIVLSRISGWNSNYAELEKAFAAFSDWQNEQKATLSEWFKDSTQAALSTPTPDVQN